MVALHDHVVSFGAIENAVHRREDRLVCLLERVLLAVHLHTQSDPRWNGHQYACDHHQF